MSVARTRRPREAERGARSLRRLHPDAPARALDDLPHDGETDARALDGHLAEALEDLEDLGVVSGIDADAVVAHEARDHAVLKLGADLDLGAFRVAEVLDRVGQEVRNHLLDLHADAP